MLFKHRVLRVMHRSWSVCTSFACLVAVYGCMGAAVPRHTPVIRRGASPQGRHNLVMSLFIQCVWSGWVECSGWWGAAGLGRGAEPVFFSGVCWQ